MANFSFNRTSVNSRKFSFPFHRIHSFSAGKLKILHSPSIFFPRLLLSSRNGGAQLGRGLKEIYFFQKDGETGRPGGIASKLVFGHLGG